MTQDLVSLQLRMDANISRLEKQLAQGQRTFDRKADQIEARAKRLDKNLANMGREAANFARPMELGAQVALGAIVAMSYQAARRAEAVNGAFEQTFRDMPAEARKATAAIANDFNRLETDVKDNFTQLRSVLTALGVEGEQSLAIVDQLQRRSLDIAAFRDVGDAEAFRAVISGITGETEPLKRFGIVVNETAVKAELLRLGFKGNATQASEAAKSIARANIVLRQSQEMHGQVARETDTTAEAEKRLKKEFFEAAETLGKEFLPVATELLKWASDALDAFNDLPTGVQASGLALIALVATGGPIVRAITGLIKLRTAAIEARAAMALVPGRGGAGGGAAVLPVVGTAAIGAGLLVSQASFAPAPPRPTAPVEERLAYARRYQSTATGYIRRLEQEKSAQDTRLSSLRTGINSLMGFGAAAAADSAAVDPGGGFTLSPGQTHPTGGTGGPTRSGATAANDARRVADARAALEIERAIAVARATGDAAAIEAAEEREELARLVKDYESAGYVDAVFQAQSHLALLNQAEALADQREKTEESINQLLEASEARTRRREEGERLINDQLIDRLGYEAQLAAATGDEGAIRIAERRLFIEQRINDLLRLRPDLAEADRRTMAGSEFDALNSADQGRESARAFIDVLRSENIWQAAGERFREAAFDNLESMLAELFKGASGGGGGNIFSTIAGFFTGGRKAVSGRSATPGFPVLIGERRPEVFVPNVPGSIVPSISAAMARSKGSSGGLTQVFQVNAQGAVLAESLVAELKASGATMAGQAGVAAYGRAKADTMSELRRRQEYSAR